MPWKVTIEYETELKEKIYLTKGQALNAQLGVALHAEVFGYKILSSEVEEIKEVVKE